MRGSGIGMDDLDDVDGGARCSRDACCSNARSKVDNKPSPGYVEDGPATCFTTPIQSFERRYLESAAKPLSRDLARRCAERHLGESGSR